MKLLIIKKFSWLFLFTLAHLWFMVFNWQLFIIMLDINLGFGVVRIPPFVVFFLIGFIILTIQSWTGYVNNLHRYIRDLEEELEHRDKNHQRTTISMSPNDIPRERPPSASTGIVSDPELGYGGGPEAEQSQGNHTDSDT